LKIEKKLLGENHIDYAVTLNNLCITLENLKDFENANVCYQKVLKIKKNHYGEDHIEYTKTLNNVSSTFEKLGEYEKAIDGF
jgi:tetratricopeptide (TPR) repeat protein